MEEKNKYNATFFPKFIAHSSSSAAAAAAAARNYTMGVFWRALCWQNFKSILKVLSCRRQETEHGFSSELS